MTAPKAPTKAAACLNPGEKIKHRKKWTAIRSVVWNGPNTVITLVTGALVTYQHRQIIAYWFAQRTAEERGARQHYTPSMTTDNRADSEHGELMRHK